MIVLLAPGAERLRGIRRAIEALWPSRSPVRHQAQIQRKRVAT
jgi:hypothetical protein